MSAIVTDIGTMLRKLTSGGSVRAQLARASLWMLAGTGVQQLFAMLGSIGAARILGETEFGAFGAVRSTTLLFAAVAGTGVGVAATRYVAALRTVDPARAGRVVGLILTIAWTISATGALLCVALSRVIAQNGFHAAGLALPIAISAVAIVFAIVGGVQQGVLGGLERFGVSAALIGAEGIASAVLMVAGARWGGVTGAVSGFVVGTGLVFVFKQGLMMAACRRASIAITTVGMRGETSIIGAFVVPAVLLGVATQPAEWLSRMLLARGPNGLAEVGLLTAAFGWAQLVLFIPSQVAGPTLPLLTKLSAAGDRAGYKKLLTESALVVFGVALAVAVPLAIASPLIMRAYGRGFSRGSAALSVIVLAYAVGAVTMVFRGTLLSSGRAWLQNAHVAIWGLVLIGSFFALRRFGALGLAESYGAAFVTLAVIQLVTIRRTR